MAVSAGGGAVSLGTITGAWVLVGGAAVRVATAVAGALVRVALASVAIRVTAGDNVAVGLAVLLGNGVALGSLTVELAARVGWATGADRGPLVAVAAGAVVGDGGTTVAEEHAARSAQENRMRMWRIVTPFMRSNPSFAGGSGSIFGS